MLRPPRIIFRTFILLVVLFLSWKLHHKMTNVQQNGNHIPTWIFILATHPMMLLPSHQYSPQPLALLALRTIWSLMILFPQLHVFTLMRYHLTGQIYSRALQQPTLTQTKLLPINYMPLGMTLLMHLQIPVVQLFILLMKLIGINLLLTLQNLLSWLKNPLLTMPTLPLRNLHHAQPALFPSSWAPITPRDLIIWPAQNWHHPYSTHVKQTFEANFTAQQKLSLEQDINFLPLHSTTSWENGHNNP